MIVSAAVDVTAIAEYGRLLGREAEPTRAAVRAFRWKVVRFALLLTVVVTPVLAVSYASRTADRTEFLALVGVVAVSPVLAAVSSMLSGECVARGAPVLPVEDDRVDEQARAGELSRWHSQDRAAEVDPVAGDVLNHGDVSDDADVFAREPVEY